MFSNDSQAVYVGAINDASCFQYCSNTTNCLGVKIRNGNCYATSLFDPFTAETCLSSDKCFSVESKF